jgi:hypothetical protein
VTRPKIVLGILAIGAIVTVLGLLFGLEGKSSATPERPQSASQARTLRIKAGELGEKAQLVVRRRNAAVRRHAISTLANPPDSLTVAAIRDLVLTYSTANGEPNPQGSVFMTTRQGAQDVEQSGATVNSNEPVYMVVVNGSFVGYAISTPQGGLPKATSMTFEFDTSDLRMVDYSFTQKTPNTASLGSGTPINP